VAGVVMGLFSTLTAMGATVFNQKRDFAGAPVNREAMEAHVRRSKVFLAFIADNYFDSEPCRWEVEEAARVGVSRFYRCFRESTICLQSSLGNFSR
jgi:hypothetical protein